VTAADVAEAGSLVAHLPSQGMRAGPVTCGHI